MPSAWWSRYPEDHRAFEEAGGFLLHASGVVRGGSGMLFCGPSGIGKSTIAARLARDAILLSEECVAVREVGDRFLVGRLPAPLSFRQIRRHAGEAPLAGLFLLDRPPPGGCTRMREAEAVWRLQSQLYPADDSPAAIERRLARLHRLVRKVPARRLALRIDEDPVPVIEKILGRSLLPPGIGNRLVDLLHQRIPPCASVWKRARAEGIVPLLGHLARRGEIDLPADAVEPLVREHTVQLGIEGMRRSDLDRLAGPARNLPVILFKGAAFLAEGRYPPGVRSMVDFDLAARPEDVRAWEAALVDLGYRRSSHGEIRYWRAEPWPSVVEILPAPSGWMERSRPLGDTPFRGLSVEDELPMLARNLLVDHGSPRAIGLLDIAQAIRRPDATPDPAALAERAGPGFGAWILAEALRMAAPLSDVPMPAVAAPVPSPRIRNAIRRHWSAAPSLAKGHLLARLVDAPPPSRKLHDLLRRLWPVRDFLRHRYALPVGHARLQRIYEQGREGIRAAVTLATASNPSDSSANSSEKGI